MSNNQLSVIIEEPKWTTALPQAEAVAHKVFSQVIDYVCTHEEIDFLGAGKPLLVNLALDNDQAVHQLNLEFRQMDKPTNVLSFAKIDEPDFEEYLEQTAEIELGDIIIALETMQQEAALKQISLHDHFCHLFAHGLLHLLGFDHQQDDEADYMESFETAILAQMNIDNPYKE